MRCLPGFLSGFPPVQITSYCSRPETIPVLHRGPSRLRRKARFAFDLQGWLGAFIAFMGLPGALFREGKHACVSLLLAHYFLQGELVLRNTCSWTWTVTAQRGQYSFVGNSGAPVYISSILRKGSQDLVSLILIINIDGRFLQMPWT